MNPFPTKTLGEVVNPVKRPESPIPGKEYRQLGVQLWGRGAYERESVDGGGTKYETLSRVETDDIVVNKIWARNGSVAVVPPNLAGCYVSGEFPTFSPVQEKLYSRWFHWFSKTPELWEQCDEKSRGTSGKNRIRPEKFLEISIPLPPVDEQRRIVCRIEELAVKVEEAKRMQELASAEMKAFFSSASSQIFESQKDNSWPVVSLAEATVRITKGESPEWQGFTYQEEGPVFIRSENVLWGQLDISRTVRIPLQFHEKLSRSQLKNGDVLINLVGASIGRSAVFSSEVPDANVNQAVAVISPDIQKLNSRYLMTFLNSSRTQEIIHGGKVETARPNVSLGDLRVLTIPLPPLGEQRRIVTQLDALQTKVDSLKKLQSETAAELDALMPSILNKAFRGEL